MDKGADLGTGIVISRKEEGLQVLEVFENLKNFRNQIATFEVEDTDTESGDIWEALVA